MSTPFKLKSSPLELWPWSKKARMRRKLKKHSKAMSEKIASEATDEELMASHYKSQ